MMSHFWTMLLWLISMLIHIHSIDYTRFCNGFGILGELHIPGFKFCGPGTKVIDRLYDEPINKLDEACKDHDLVYCETNDVNKHCLSDIDLMKTAKERENAENASIEERSAAYVVFRAISVYVNIRGLFSSCKCSLEKGGC